MMNKKLSYKDVKQLISFLEEFSWISKKFSKHNFIDVIEDIASDSLTERSVSSKDEMKGFLAGYLPKILLDKDLFLKNKDIDDFAKSLGVTILRPEKRSREEMIGIIVCDIHEKTSIELEKAYNVVNTMSNDPVILNKIKERKVRSTFNNEAYDWNNVIKEIFNKE
ncbi:TPA: hypothetical protein U5G33_005289 [Klebsiella pneumoniae]|uniref:hypothetical protein n=2 Tax=Klebsiella pneumoniae TaxID=573 RepID=UPI002AC79D57|nr:hypothetical protein [Klebsiella pneumoniae]MEC4428889.1 hypothetical protein [Klebsiella pneumoniae]MEC4439387.1 hypothetical protein [Klebsiella pneumoniae]HDO7049127.1 hypothetical protein [Klebsiella pneumoniae]HDO7070008.1 hypothetical protein [Klebsiella pneumoniae]HEN3715289.1 hypothetical protein [Klebsiella pneumoniae]